MNSIVGLERYYGAKRSAQTEGKIQMLFLQLDDELLQRLGQNAKQPAANGEDEMPDFVFYTGCNVLKTPHIALLALDIMDALGARYEVMGGPTHCCGIVQMRMGDVATSGRFGEATIDKLSHSKSGQVVSWCPSCQVQFTETTLPTLEKTRGAKPFEMTPFTLFLRKKLDRLRPLLSQRVPMRIALHRHPGIHGVVEAAEDILRAVPGITIVDLPRSGRIVLLPHGGDPPQEIVGPGLEGAKDHALLDGQGGQLIGLLQLAPLQ